MFCILEERPIEPMVYEEIEIVEDYCEEQPQQQQQPSQPTSGVRIRSGEKSGCNLSVMEVREEKEKKVRGKCTNLISVVIS